MARFLAVVVIQAPGFAGRPSRGQRSMATRNASWTASSARSKSPVSRMRVATARPDSSRNRRSTTARASAAALADGLGRLALHRRTRRSGGPRSRRSSPRDAGRSVDRLVEVGRLDQVEPTERLLRLGVRAVRRQRLAVADATVVADDVGWSASPASNSPFSRVHSLNALYASMSSPPASSARSPVGSGCRSGADSASDSPCVPATARLRPSS